MRRVMLLGMLIVVGAAGIGGKYPETLRKAAAGIKNVETVIPGHTPTTTTWAAFVEFGEFNAAFVSAVRQAVTEGKTVDQAVAGLSLPETFKNYGLQSAKAYVTNIYRELKPVQ